MTSIRKAKKERKRVTELYADNDVVKEFEAWRTNGARPKKGFVEHQFRRVSNKLKEQEITKSLFKEHPVFEQHFGKMLPAELPLNVKQEFWAAQNQYYNRMTHRKSLRLTG